MIGLCHKCGFMGDAPSQGPTEQEWDEMQALYRETVQQLEVAQLARHDLEKRLFTREQLFHDLESKLDMLLDIAMSSSDAARLSTISRIKKRKRSGDLLESIRKANQNEL